MKTTTKLRLSPLSGKHLDYKQDAILVFNPPGILCFISTNTHKSIISTFLGAKTEKEANVVEPYLKNLMKTSQL